MVALISLLAAIKNVLPILIFAIAVIYEIIDFIKILILF